MLFRSVRENWIQVAGWNIQYYLAVDGLSILLLLLTTLLTRGNEVRFEPGSTVDMVLQRAIEIDMSRVASDPAQVPPPVQRIYTQPQPQPQNTSPVPVMIPRGGAMG